MKKVLILVSIMSPFLFSGCLNTSNSFENDASVYAPVDDDSGDGITGVVSNRHKQIIQTKCLACHSAGQTFPNLAVSDDVLVANGLITSGDAENSYLILKVEGLQGNIMPKPPYPPLSTDDIQELKDWINSIPSS